jgi:ribosomal protein S18 acetylase RimI-like enzyme
MDVIPQAAVIPHAAVARYGSYAELPGPMLEDTLLLIETDPELLHGAWTVEGGYAFASVDGYGGDPCWLNVVGSPEAAARLAEAALGELGDTCCGLTAPRGLDITKWALGNEPSQWDAMVCEVPPPVQPGEERVQRLTDSAAVQAFLDRVNPHHSVRAEHPEVQLWLGVTDETSGELLALGAFTRRRRGTAYLASIATAPQSRGQGLGAAVTAALTRYAFESGDSVCTLAHYHPNEAARRVYLRLGYRTTHQSHSTPFTPRQSAGCP